MLAVTQVRTPDELQDIYKDLLKLKNSLKGSIQSLQTSTIDLKAEEKTVKSPNPSRNSLMKSQSSSLQLSNSTRRANFP